MFAFNSRASVRRLARALFVVTVALSTILGSSLAGGKVKADEYWDSKLDVPPGWDDVDLYDALYVHYGYTANRHGDYDLDYYYNDVGGFYSYYLKTRLWTSTSYPDSHLLFQSEDIAEGGDSEGVVVEARLQIESGREAGAAELLIEDEGNISEYLFIRSNRIKLYWSGATYDGGGSFDGTQWHVYRFESDPYNTPHFKVYVDGDLVLSGNGISEYNSSSAIQWGAECDRGIVSSKRFYTRWDYIYYRAEYPTPIIDVFDTGAGTYPSMFGTHKGTLTLAGNLTADKMYTYRCSGTGGHSEYVRIWGNGIDVTGTWNGYVGDWQVINFPSSFTLQAGKTYNYEIRTGSYPQIIHKHSHTVDGGTITCTDFEDANGRHYTDWIPAIKLYD